MKRILLMLLVLAVLALGISSSFAADSLTNTTDFDKAVSDAQSQNKKILLIFDQNGCYYCDLLKKNTLSDQELVSKLNDGYITVIVDVNKQPQLASKYHVFGTPVMIFLDSNQNKIGQIEGYVDANKFLDYIKGI